MLNSKLSSWLTSENVPNDQFFFFFFKHYESTFCPSAITTDWSRKWQPTPIFLPGKFHEQRSLIGYSPWGRKESDTTERLQCECLLHSVLQGQICLLLQYFLTSYFCNPVPYNEKDIFFGC